MSSHARTISNRVIRVLMLCMLFVVIAPSITHANQHENSKQGDLGTIPTRLQVPIPGLTKNAAGDIDITSRTLAEYIIKIYNFLLMASVVLATVMLVWGGFMWMTAGGGSERIGKAQEYIWNAIAGLVILFGAYLILSIVNPELTTLKPLTLQQIKPMALGYFCDERLADNEKLKQTKKGVADKLEFHWIDGREESYVATRNPQVEWISANQTKCGAAYEVSELRDGTRKKAGGTPCFGKAGCPTRNVCSQTKSGPRCVLGMISGQIIKPTNRGVDYISLYELDNNMEDSVMAQLNTSPYDTTYVLRRITDPVANKLYYIVIEINGGEWWDNNYYIGKGPNDTSRRISFSSDDTECFVVNDALNNIREKIDCAKVLWTSAELNNGITLNLDIMDQNIFGAGLGE
ncbi:hypothetical protein HY624_01205 [Candidatus Uhrbacteria bacterium]|nr:hypothetical protein [Candidatus Uhrbacteria bacterium]